MRLKSFHAPNIADAMRQVREVLGEDAIIVATREEDGMGVRVTAAVEEASTSQASGPPVGLRFAEPAEPEPIDQLNDILFNHGVPASLNQRLMDSIADFDGRDAQSLLSAALSAVFTFSPLPEGRSPRPLMLVGPPGAGKTLTVAKLCVRAALKGRPVGVISTDTVRAGGIDQLAAFTRVLKLRLMTVEDPLALADALDVQSGIEQVLIDSAGRNPYSQADLNDLRDFLVAADIEPVLVLPAGMDALEAADVATAFHRLGVRRLLVTRVDMARRLGSLLNAAYAADLAFCDAGLSPQAAEGLIPLTPNSLARLMMPAAQTNERRAKQTGTHS